MSTLSSINFALRHTPVSIMATDDETCFDVLYADEATPLVVLDDPDTLEIQRITAPRCYQYVGHARTYDGLAGKLLLAVGELLADGTLTKEDALDPD